MAESRPWPSPDHPKGVERSAPVRCVPGRLQISPPLLSHHLDPAANFRLVSRLVGMQRCAPGTWPGGREGQASGGVPERSEGALRLAASNVVRSDSVAGGSSRTPSAAASRYEVVNRTRPGTPKSAHPELHDTDDERKLASALDRLL